jgi:hypothetical protein
MLQINEINIIFMEYSNIFYDSDEKLGNKSMILIII